MSAARPDWERVLGEHAFIEFTVCECGWDGQIDRSAIGHRAHLAAALDAAYVAHLGAEETREALARALAIERDYDGCFIRRDEALAAGDAEDAATEDEDCAWWTERSSAALATLTDDRSTTP